MRSGFIINANEILDSCDIQRVISHFVDLKHKGSEWEGCCPFHNEKTPSFKLNANKGFFKCFGCEEGEMQ